MAKGLVYVSDQEPGIRRRRAGRGFAYITPDGKPLTPEERRRVEKLAVPPAYQDVWICARPDGHLQATGRDARGRKQYRYHPDFQAMQAGTKYSLLTDFAQALPTLRDRIARDLRQGPGGMQFTLAALVLLLDRSFLRIGNPGYVAQNGSYGAATLLRRHVRLGKDGIRLDFTAKGGKRLRRVLQDRRLHRVLQAVGDLPGRNLFTYIDDAGMARPVHSGEVNAYLAEVMGEGMTAKTFRTWGGTLAAFGHAAAQPAEGPLSIKAMAAAAAECLCNTPAVCRSAYIHPEVLGLAELTPEARIKRLSAAAEDSPARLRAEERRLFAFLNSTRKGKR